MACLKVSVTLMVAMLLIAAPVCAEDEYGNDYGGDYGEEGGGYGADPYGGGGYGDDYGMGGGMGGMGGPPDASERIPGVLDLDKYTYHKVIDGSYPAMVLFYYPENPDFMEEYTTLADEMAEHQDLILAKVDAETDAPLAGQYGIESGPALVFFPKGSTEPVKYEGEMVADDIKEYLADLVGEVGQLKELSPLVAKFLSNKGSRDKTLKEAEAAVAGLLDPAAGYGKWYVKIMANVIKKGDEYIANEFTRLLRMVYDEADSLKDEKLAEFRQRITVLKVFDPALKEVEKKKKKEMEDGDDVTIDDKDEL